MAPSAECLAHHVKLTMYKLIELLHQDARRLLIQVNMETNLIITCLHIISIIDLQDHPIITAWWPLGWLTQMPWHKQPWWLVLLIIPVFIHHYPCLFTGPNAALSIVAATAVPWQEAVGGLTSPGLGSFRAQRLEQHGSATRSAFTEDPTVVKHVCWCLFTMSSLP